MNQEDFQKVLDRAALLVSIRIHSVRELHRKLNSKFPGKENIVDEVISELQRTLVLDDRKFAEEFVNHRLSTAPKGKKMLELELIKKGIDRDIIHEALECCEMDEFALARELAAKKLNTIDKKLSVQKKKERLFRFLGSKGFGADVVMKVIHTVEIK